MIIDKIIVYRLNMPLKEVFETSMGVETHREFLLLEVHSDGVIGYGECTAMDIPVYNEETLDTVEHILETYLIPKVLEVDLKNPNVFHDIFSWIRGHNMAKATLEGALWDIYCRQKGISLSKALGGTRNEIAVGISMGIERDIPKLLNQINSFLKEGYQRFKLKIKPGVDVEPIRAIRREFGMDLPLMADANSAYNLNDFDILKELDQFGLMMIEQPLSHDDIIDHATLQRELKTPICLDESITSSEAARKAIQLGSCRIINIKIGRVGGLSEAKRVHDVCASYQVPVWCGGMQESGIGRAHNIAIASLSNFSIPGDTSPSSRYWSKDITTKEIEFSRPGFLTVPEEPGIGFELDREVFESYLLNKKSYSI